ncbi:tRNA 2-thiocytidine biosynthesis protein TtcA [Enterococcus cecorum]|uniref:tRNA 2-thiocytidine biosynthesis TtcA family protein n=1 Tax=Enterococcus cecorum TaxID=44008 RepID=UPI0006430123|nr:tRNA 2-thiocytidine biosynthesis TtcA family protein [Enterococcus cecorum]KLO66933.1 ATPase [Enterococcus cecorum]CAI3486209.1 tRNA 2-thiocytidine biosynthesis protein TtcA [Enterococcus cecorum]
MGTTHKKDNQRYYNPIRKAILNYKMIEPGEKVAIGLSGGKDSTTLLYLLDTIKKQQRLGFDFDIHPMVLDMGMDMDLTPLKEFCASLGYELDIVPTDIAKIVFDIRQEKNPCSLCANLRRGILYQTAKERGCSKVALGHHLDDAIETFMMNWLFHGEFRSFEPITYLTRSEVSIIRPMLYVEETAIKHFVQREGLPVIFNPCPADKKTKREEMKQLVSRLSVTYPEVRQKFLKGMETGTYENFWTPKLVETSNKKEMIIKDEIHEQCNCR